MDNLNQEILSQNLLLTQKCSVYKDALKLALEGLKNLKEYDMTNISCLTIREVNKILDKK